MRWHRRLHPAISTLSSEQAIGRVGICAEQRIVLKRDLVLHAGQGGGSVTYGPLYAGLPYNMLGFWGSFTMNIPTLYSQGVLNPAAYDAAACR